MNIRAIETEYQGYRFRSRLEARWARFFDASDVRYVYEPEGFEMEGVRYLPDFWLPQLRYYIEIKPERPTPLEHEKAQRLADGSGHPLFLLIDVPAAFTFSPRDGGRFVGSHLGFFPSEPFDGRYGWGECSSCGRVDLGLDGEEFEVQRRHGHKHARIQPDTPKLVRAYREARSARFENYPRNMRRALEDTRVI